MKVDLGFSAFRTKTAALAHFKRILNDAPMGAALVGEAEREVLALLRRHPEAAQKIGPGVSRIVVRKAPNFNTRCFYVRRVDGTSTDFSYRSCVSARAKTLEQRWSTACRRAVAGDVAHFKRTAFGTGPTVASALSGERVAWGDAHVDHAPPNTFRQIVAAFDDPDASRLSPPGDNDDACRFTCGETRERFVEHHNRLADLRIVSADENLRLPRS